MNARRKRKGGGAARYVRSVRRDLRTGGVIGVGLWRVSRGRFPWQPARHRRLRAH